MVNDNAPYVYLTDGGHFENMGLYELVRRRCTNIVICDAEQDGDLNFQGIGMAIRKCRIDFGAEICLDLSTLNPSGADRSSATNFIEGTITYPNNFQGNILYIKSLFTPGLPPDLVNYRKEHSAFPDDSTLNQWFTESQFESYRRIGHFTVVPDKVAASPSLDVSDADLDLDIDPNLPSVRRWLERLQPRCESQPPFSSFSTSIHTGCTTSAPCLTPHCGLPSQKCPKFPQNRRPEIRL